MRLSIATSPSRKGTMASPDMAGGGCSASAGIVTMSLTESTIMPRAVAVNAGAAKQELPLDDLAEALIGVCSQA